MPVPQVPAFAISGPSRLGRQLDMRSALMRLRANGKLDSGKFSQVKFFAFWRELSH
jgi:hypothetical protein